MSSGTVVELAKNCSDLSREQKENIVPIDKGGPKNLGILWDQS